MDMDLKTGLLRYTGPLMSNRYNYFFNPNTCHVCKSANNGLLELCDRCFMISYCNVVHKMMHRAEHMEICMLIEDMLLESPWYYTRQLTMSEWQNSKRELKELVERRMSRPLLQHEIQMLMFAKSCLICHRQSDLNTCIKCFSANFCFDHSQDFYKFHSSSCKELLISLNFDISNISNAILNHKSLKFYMFPDKFRLALNMFNFIKLYVHPRNKIYTINCMSRMDYYYSEHVTDPLTVYYGMQDANLIDFLSKSVCVVHIIDSNILGPTAYLTWELLLHLLRNKVQKMIIVLKGPVLNIQSFRIKICSKCKSSKKVITFEVHPMLYQNYVFNIAYRRPNVIVGFQPQSCDITMNSLIALQKQDCPVLLTTISLFRARQLATCINDVLGIAVRPILIAKNRFKSLLPRKNFDTEGVYYRNDYLLVYKNLKNSNEPTPECSESLL